MSHSEHHEEPHIVGYGTQIQVWMCLIGLTGLTIAMSALNVSPFIGVAIAFVIASIKVSLVLSFFMHLNYEEVQFPLMLLVAFYTIGIIFILTFPDYLYR